MQFRSVYCYCLFPIPNSQPTATEHFQLPLCTDLEQSSAAYHICSVTSRLLLSLEDILLRTLLPIITVVVPVKWHCHLWTMLDMLIALTYLLTYLLHNAAACIHGDTGHKASIISNKKHLSVRNDEHHCTKMECEG